MCYLQKEGGFLFFKDVSQARELWWNWYDKKASVWKGVTRKDFQAGKLKGMVWQWANVSLFCVEAPSLVSDKAQRRGMKAIMMRDEEKVHFV